MDAGHYLLRRIDFKTRWVWANIPSANTESVLCGQICFGHLADFTS
jgi:hypothetical protein